MTSPQYRRAFDYNPASGDTRQREPTVGTPRWARERAMVDYARYLALLDSGEYRTVNVMCRAHNGGRCYSNAATRRRLLAMGDETQSQPKSHRRAA